MCASPRADPPRVAGAAVANSSRCFGIGATTRMLGISLVTHRQTTAIKAASCMCRLLRAGRRDWRHTCRLPAAPAGWGVVAGPASLQTASKPFANRHLALPASNGACMDEECRACWLLLIRAEGALGAARP